MSSTPVVKDRFVILVRPVGVGVWVGLLLLPPPPPPPPYEPPPRPTAMGVVHALLLLLLLWGALIGTPAAPGCSVHVAVGMINSLLKGMAVGLMRWEWHPPPPPAPPPLVGGEEEVGGAEEEEEEEGAVGGGVGREGNWKHPLSEEELL